MFKSSDISLQELADECAYIGAQAITTEMHNAVALQAWQAGNKDAAARAYVEWYFAGFDGCNILSSAPTPADEYGTYDSIDVDFVHNGTHSRFTVWCDNFGYGPRMYGEY